MTQLALFETAFLSSDTMQSEMYRLALSWVAGRRARREITAATATRNRSSLIGFAVSYGQRPVRNLSRHDIERWLETRSGVAPGTRRHEWSTIRGFTRWLRAERHITRDPFVGLQAPKVPRSVPRALPHDDIDRLRHVVTDHRSRLIIELMYGLGLRRGEVCALEVGDYDRIARTLHVRGKGGHERLLPVTTPVATAIEAYLRTVPPTAGPLVRKQRGDGPLGPTQVSKLVRRWLEDAGVKEHPGDGRACHSLRHTRASELAEVPGITVTVLQDFLGHVSLSSTQVYLRRATLHRIREALEASPAPA